MLKKILKGLAIGSAAVAIAASAQADQEINIFGASAQYKYWTEGAGNFLQSIGCDAEDVWQSYGEVDSRDSGISICNYDMSLTTASYGTVTNGDGADDYPGENIIIRYATFASAEGLLAAREEDPSDAESGACDSYGDDYRLMADESTATFSRGDEASIYEGVTSEKCVDVTLGTSDIDPECFNQTTEGPWKWDQFSDEGNSDFTYNGVTYPGEIGTYNQWGTAWYAYNYNNDDSDWVYREFIPGSPLPDTDWETEDDMGKANPFVVPFAFYVNNDATTPVPVTNLTKSMAQLIFSGQVGDWTLFVDDDTYSLPVTVCIRHAGSGTHATLDYAVVRADGVGLLSFANHPATADEYSPTVITNKGSSDNVECSGFIPGAISYADADKLTTSTDLVACTSDSKGENCRIGYQGNAPTRTNVKSCKYEFWAANVVYYKNAEDSDLLQDLISFASTSSNMAAGKALFWASQDELQCDRATCQDTIRPNPNL